MADREMVIKEYESFVDKYECFCSSDDYVFEMHKAVLALLKEQEAVEPTHEDFHDMDFDGVRRGFRFYYCGACDSHISVSHKFCPECGRKIDWSKGRETKKRGEKDERKTGGEGRVQED